MAPTAEAIAQLSASTAVRLLLAEEVANRVRAFAADNTRQVIFRSADNHIHEFKAG